MTGRLPYHVFETSDYVDGGFNMLPAKLRQVGYVSLHRPVRPPLLLTDPNPPGGCSLPAQKTHQVGKWHLGLLLPWMTPVGRGYDSSLGFLSGGVSRTIIAGIWVAFFQECQR